METLLQKTRKMSHLFRQLAGRDVDLGRVARELRDLVSCNVYVLSRKGGLLGYALSDNVSCDVLDGEILPGDRVPVDYNDRLLQIEETVCNLTQENGKCLFRRDRACRFEGKVITIIPLVGGVERQGTLLLAKYDGQFDDEDLVLAEYAATVITMEVLRSRALEAEEDARKKAAVQFAVGALSFSEMEAVRHVFDELNGTEGFLVASKIADRVGITRSVIVNALRKFESAGVIESRSLGMKGTYIRVLNDRLVDELRNMRH
ncbi:MAG: GTP-sensing pleiotropic transcriptional regulator CodY [Firmicutes bacterium]|jgi:transcriptional pleiotropic repressor|nr:GTP-sensing pleiotropic transcriptional regulator CodY [Bacillota bacterium]